LVWCRYNKFQIGRRKKRGRKGIERGEGKKEVEEDDDNDEANDDDDDDDDVTHK